MVLEGIGVFWLTSKDTVSYATETAVNFQFECLHSIQGILWEMFTNKEYQCDSETISHSSFQAVLKPVQNIVSLDAHSVNKIITVDSNFL